jgi:uncharacterized repeat protein (TIGR01451 family)
MQYQTKWVRNMLKLFSSGSSSLMRTFLLVGLMLGSLGVAIASQQLSLVNVRAAATLSKHDGYAPDVSIKIASSIDQETVTYTLTIRNAADGGIIRKRIPILFTDIIPKGLSNIRVTGDYWETQVRTTVRPMITGRYRGNYPVPANTTLPAITITATITSDAGDMLTNSASVHVQGNRDRGHNQAVVHDNITSTSPSAPSPNSDNSTCNDQTDNSPCEQRSLHITVQRRVRISAQESIDTSDQQNTSASSDTSNSSSNTSPNLSPNSSPSLSPNLSPNSNPSLSPNLSPNSNPGKGSTDPFPALPNTGSSPLLT